MEQSGHFCQLKEGIKLMRLRVCSDFFESEKAFDYVTKWIGKGSDIETALSNAEHGKASEKEIAKLFTNFWGMKLNPIRLFRTSKGLGRSPPFI